ncbi:hypothetical protein G6F31_017581 [Rhizopus arrhizus]|nr:hypothetical protein G6F31_017581 [Rhizopus arrhizus]
MADDDHPPHAFQQRQVALQDGRVGVDPARHHLGGQAVECGDGKLRVGIGAVGPGARARTADAEPRVAVFARLDDGRLGPDLGHQRIARAAAFHRVAQVGGPASAQESVQPAFAPVRRGFPRGARHAAAMPEGQRRAAAGGFGSSAARRVG